MVCKIRKKVHENTQIDIVTITATINFHVESVILDIQNLVIQLEIFCYLHLQNGTYIFKTF